MANRYVYTGGSNTSPYDTWAKAATTLTTAISGSAAGDDFWVASDHAESTAGAITLSFPGTATAPNRIMSVDRAGSTPPVGADVLAGASVSSSGNTSITIGGSYIYMYGLTFNAGVGGTTTANLTLTQGGNRVYEACAFNIATTGASSRIINSFTDTKTECINCTVSFGSTSQGLNITTGNFHWRNKPGSTAITGATLPTTLAPNSSTSTLGTKNVFSGLDLSALGSGKTLIAAGSTGFDIINCKLDAAVTISGTPGFNYNPGIRVLGSGSAGIVRREEIYLYQGTLTTETTIKRTAGASDGVTAYSWKIVTTANSKRTAPFETFDGAIWNTTTGSAKTLTIHTVTDNVTLTDAEIWLEVEYLGSSATPVSTLITDANATVLTTAANQATSTEAWTTTGLGTPVYQKLEVTFTPQMAGLFRWKVRVAKASTTVYVCPKPVIS